MRTASALAPALVLAAALAGGCGGDRSGRDSTASVDSTMFGDDRATQGDTARVSTDVALLEQLIDKYEGLDVVMDQLAGPNSGSAVGGQAWKGDRHEDATKARLLGLLQTEFGERYHPRTPEGAAKTTDSIGVLPHKGGARALDALVLSHHREVARAIDDALPSVRNSRVREALVSLSADLRKEIQKLTAGRPASGSG